MPLSAGDKLGHFEVVGAIGQGGMGEVYKARDTRLDRTVAIKVLHRLVSSDPAFRERFEREARAVSSLNHPHICTLHDVGSEGGQRDPGGLCAHLVYTQSGGLWAVAFDLETLESTSSPTIVLEDIYSSDRIDYVAISQVETLVYAAGETKVGGGLTLAWVDREGRVTPVAAEPAAYNAPRLSPDGSQLAVSISDLGEEEAWIFDVVRGTRTRVGGSAPTWTPDGRRVTYTTDTDMYSRRADGSGEAELVLPVREGSQWPTSWSPDGRSLVFYEMHPSTGRDIWMLPLDSDRVSYGARSL